MEQKARLTFLGTGTSSGIPMIGCDCAVCRSADPRDKRLRAAALVEYGGLTILVDAGPDLRWQMLRAGVRHLDAILLTHNHKDHTAGLDDVRAFNLCERHPVNIYCQPYVEDTLHREYAYAFAEQKYPGAPEWHLHRIDGAHPFLVHSNAGEEVLSWERGFGYHHLPPQSDADATAEVIPIQGWHHREKKLSVLGYRFGNIAYLTDIKMLDSEAEFDKLKGVEYVTLGCVKVGDHHSHPSLPEALDFFARVGARESYITHMSHQLPCHEAFAAMLPPHVHPAWDGLVIG
ncbi:MAG: MBL fold metallo-hydrolase [Bacteroidales bacterium]|nr:MBL fold metallo-hydrolase [Bacteroidales bacterium]MBR4586463.1 MBL fold metallo-hydrolase [Bacteroidales bacterium]